ncbi:MAG: ATP-dependent helicase HrpB [Bdellovibrionaceae bacterium]|nr:ATP-dependent helicase HrpB [Pseudobdellovibrionaceae bacterium]
MGKIHLPVDDFLEDIGALLSANDALVVTAAPGAGKTTRLPPACLNWVPGKILVLEPRRMAAIAAASRIAEENGWTAGVEVGWQVRFDNKSTDQTRLLFLTEALLARKMMSDPELKGVDLVIIDEFHERSLHTDLTLGLLKELRELGRDIKIVVMSATLMAEKISDYLDGAPIVSVPGKLFPLEVTHRKTTQRLRTDDEFYVSLIETVKEAQRRTQKDLLVFLPGVGEIEKTRERLAPWAQTQSVDLIPLHGSLSLDEQKRALQKGRRQRVVLSTNIAESSVTVDGVDTVIDSGLAKINRFDVRTNFSRLELSRISQNSAIQRSGRAARQFPGKAYRLWTVHDELSMSKDETPEIQRADLSEGLLFLAHQGVRDFQSFSWFERPPKNILSNAEKTLRAIEALDPENHLTNRGEKLLRYPLPPRLASLLLTAEELESQGHEGAKETAARIAALLQERDFVRDETARSHLGDKLECDLQLRLELMDRFQPRHLMASVQQLRNLLKVSTKSYVPDGEIIRLLLLSAFPDRLCRRRGGSERALMVGGRGVKLGPVSLVKDSEFLIALQGMEGLSDTETVINIACGLSKEFVLKHLAGRIERVQDLAFDEQKGKVFMREYRSFEGLPLDEPTLTVPSTEALRQKMPELLVSRFEQVLTLNEDLSRWMARWNFLQRHDEEALAFSFDEKLHEIFEEASFGENSFEAAAKKDLVYFFEKALPTSLRARLEKEIPDRLAVPSGNKLRVTYPSDKDPYLEVRLQEVFGWLKTPLLLGKVPLTLHLLAPNFRPVQVTSDLASFWSNGYSEVRKELRSRYPKHSWPEDPLTAKAESKGRPRQ